MPDSVPLAMTMPGVPGSLLPRFQVITWLLPVLLTRVLSEVPSAKA